LRALVHESVTRGLAGIERLAGIPGTLGGAVFMNAGAFGQEVSTVIEEVEYIELSSGQSCRASRDELGFGYRTSRFAGTDAVITSCRCSFASGNRAALECEYHQVLTRRRQKQPLDLPNCGSVFKNPPGQGAGRHIESAGLKGVRVGGIQVSTKHANFFVNTGLGTASDFRKLVAVVQRAVHERTGLLLEPEVAFVGHFDIPLYQPET